MIHIFTFSISSKAISLFTDETWNICLLNFVWNKNSIKKLLIIN